MLEPRSRRVQADGRLYALLGDVALESSGNAHPTGLALVNLVTGARRPLRWPSSFRTAASTFLQAASEPDGPLVAVSFVDSYYAPSHSPAVDLWVLDMRTARLTHVPGFPAAQDFGQSGLAWTANGRLVIAAVSNPGRAVVGIWRLGQTALPLHGVPDMRDNGYLGLVPTFG